MISYDENDILFKTAETMAAELNSLYENNCSGRRDLLELMDANDNFGMEEITCENVKSIKERLTLWLSAYKQPGRVKIDLMLRHFKDIYPETCRLYRAFIDDNHLENATSAWKLLDFILSEIDHDITEYSEAEIDGLMRLLDVDATRTSANMFAKFLSEKEVGQHLTKWVYTFEPRKRFEYSKEAYALTDFSIMAYCVFNEEMWVRQNLVEKAVGSRIYADLWLFVALHFVCALRTSDMKRIPAPRLPYDGKSVLIDVLSGKFSRENAVALCDELLIRMKLKPIRPGKTVHLEKVPELKLFISESLKFPLGIIIAISLAHHPEVNAGDGFIGSSNDFRNVRDFFGESFLRAIGKKRFSPRRCNKSYLQGIEAVTNDSPGKPKGYMLAALARSHKGGIGSLPETTEIYLKDANFVGYKPEFIMREMFERGVFSFIPAVLLEIYAGKDYKMLPVTPQTKLIKELGLAAHQIEWVIAAAETALNTSRIIVNAILENPGCVNKNIGDILQNIASGNAPGRQSECLCLMTAAGFPCHNPDRDSCIGCGYEILTKAAMHTLMSEYVRLTGLKSSADKTDAWRFEKMLRQAIMPAIAEVISALKIFYKDADITGILDIVEGGLNYVDNGL